MRKSTPVMVFFLALLVGCGPTYRPFTSNMQDQFQWSESELKRIQFYLSEDVVLRRDLRQGESAIRGGKILIEEGRRVEEILFEKNTPGVLMFMPKENRMAIGFESGNERFLMFGPNPKTSDRYVLLAADWNRSYGKVTYNGKQYRTSSNNAFAGLMVDMNKINKVSVNRRRAKGRTI